MKTFFLILAFISFVFPCFCKAGDIQSASNRITVTPPKFELWASQGDNLTEYLRITNEDDQPALMALSLDDFTITSDNGSVVLGQNFSLPNQLKSWISFDQKGYEFKPKETKIVKYKINVPENAYPGGNYAAIVVSMDRVNRNTQENTAEAKVVSMVMLSVAGDIRDNARAESFTYTKLHKGNADLSDFILKIKNNGNNHIMPRGTIVITNFLGKKIDEIPLENENVLPNNSRLITTSWKTKKYLFGRYNANLIAVYGYKEDKKINESINFYVFTKPALTLFWSIFIVILVLVGGPIWLIIRKAKRKSKN